MIPPSFDNKASRVPESGKTRSLRSSYYNHKARCQTAFQNRTVEHSVTEGNTVRKEVIVIKVATEGCAVGVMCPKGLALLKELP